MMNIYVASSWRNKERQQAVVHALREAGHSVYDFFHPKPGNEGMAWREIENDPNWIRDPKRFRAGLEHPLAQEAFHLDMDALRAADACVLVLPCGRSAHLELGWAAGAGKRSVVLLDDPVSEPELMYLATDRICLEIEEVVDAVESFQDWAVKLEAQDAWVVHYRGGTARFRMTRREAEEEAAALQARGVEAYAVPAAEAESQLSRSGTNVEAALLAVEAPYGRNAGIICDTPRGPCACGAWH